MEVEATLEFTESLLQSWQEIQLQSDDELENKPDWSSKLEKILTKLEKFIWDSGNLKSFEKGSFNKAFL